MTSHKRVSITAQDNAKIAEEIFRVDGKIVNVELEGRIDVEVSGKPDLRKLTGVEKRDFLNSLRFLIASDLGLARSSTLIEETVQRIFNEYEKMRVRSHLKSSTPKRQEVDLQELARHLRVDDETALDVIQSEFYETEYQHAWLENVWLDGEYVQVYHIVDGFKGLRIV